MSLCVLHDTHTFVTNSYFYFAQPRAILFQNTPHDPDVPHGALCNSIWETTKPAAYPASCSNWWGDIQPCLKKLSGGCKHDTCAAGNPSLSSSLEVPVTSHSKLKHIVVKAIMQIFYMANCSIDVWWQNVEEYRKQMLCIARLILKSIS